MWYDSGMETEKEIILKQPDLSALIGKPLVAFKDGNKVQIGEIVGAYVEHSNVHVRSSVTDPQIKRMLGIPDVPEAAKA